MAPRRWDVEGGEGLSILKRAEIASTRTPINIPQPSEAVQVQLTAPPPATRKLPYEPDDPRLQLYRLHEAAYILTAGLTFPQFYPAESVIEITASMPVANNWEYLGSKPIPKTYAERVAARDAALK